MQPHVNAAGNQALADLQGQNTAAALRKITTIQAAQLRQANRPNPVLQAILTSRFNIGGSGGGVSPLIGRTLKAIGPGLAKLAASAGPAGLALAGIAIVAAGAALAVAKLSETAMDGAKALKSISQGRAATGGSYRDFEALRAAGSIAGTSPESLASSISEAIQSGAGAALAQKLGISTVRGPFGDLNDAAAANKIINAIANAGSRGEADRMAAQLGDKSLAQFFDLTPAEKKLIGQGAAGAPDDRSVRAARDVSAQFAILGATVERITRGGLFVKIMAGVGAGLELVNRFVARFESFLNAIDAVLDRIMNALGMKQGQTAQERNTRAVEANTQALREFGTFGGGANAARALPSGLRGHHMGDAAVRNALGGAF